MKINPDLLIREPYRTFSGVIWEEVRYHVSPNKKYVLVVSHCWEYRNGCNACLFHLLDDSGSIIEDFNPHTTQGIVRWSDDSHFLGIVTSHLINRGVLIMDLVRHQFTFVRSRCNHFNFNDSTLIFTIPEREIELTNSDSLVGGGKSSLPRVKFLKPPDVIIQLSSLPFYSKNELANICEVKNDVLEINLEPIKDGFWPFHGRFPQNTWDSFNGREFEVYQLEAFAKYGDEQSIKWLNEIKSMSNKRYESGWPVSYYLGKRERE